MAAILSECTSRLEALEALVGDEANATYAVVATEVRDPMPYGIACRVVTWDLLPHDAMPQVEAIGDRLDRAWGMVKHLKSVKDTEPHAPASPQ